MQRLCATFFCLLLLSIGMKDLIVYMVYVANMDLVTERFCQNMDQLTCKGKCYLAEVFGKASSEEEDILNLPAPVDKTSFVVVKTTLFKIPTYESRLMLKIKHDSLFTFFGLAPPTPPPRFFVV